MNNNKFPILFIGHGSPMNLIEKNPWTENWKLMTQLVLEKTGRKPKAILMLSAHWYTRGTFLQVDEQPGMIFDMYGFPKPIYELDYPVKTSATLIHRVQELLGAEVTLQANRGYDHGAYAPLLKMFPEADIPVVQLSINGVQDAKYWFETGQKLAPLCEEDILIIGSGDIVHNLRTLNPHMMNDGTVAVKAFEKRILELLHTTDAADGIKGLLNWRAIEGAMDAAESPDHLAPLFYCLGAALGIGLEEGKSLKMPSVNVWNGDFVMGSLSMTSLAWGL